MPNGLKDNFKSLLVKDLAMGTALAASLLSLVSLGLAVASFSRLDDLDDLEGRINTVENSVDANSDAIAGIRDTAEDNEEDIGRLEADLNELEERLANEEEARANLEQVKSLTTHPYFTHI